MEINKTLIGQATGKAGGLIAQTYHSKTIFRTAFFKYHYPDTEKQQQAQKIYWAWQRQTNYFYDTIKKHFAPLNIKNTSIYGTITSQLIKTANIFDRDEYNRPLKYIGPIKRQPRLLYVHEFEIYKDSEMVHGSFFLETTFEREDTSDIEITFLAIDTKNKALAVCPCINDNGLLYFEFQDVENFKDQNSKLIYIAYQSRQHLTNFQLCKQIL